MAGLNLFTNNAASTLASSINSSVTSLTVASGQGTLFPNPTAGQYFYCTLSNTAGTIIEIVKVTARSTDTFTIVRGQDNTTASAFSAGDKVELRLTAADLQNFPQLDSTNTFATTQTFTVAPVFTDATGTRSAISAAKSGANSDITSITGLTTALTVAQGGTGVTTSTGTGSTVLSTSPTLTTPNLGTPSAATLTNATGLPLSTGVTGTLPVANGGTGLTTAGTANQVLTTNGTTLSYAKVGIANLSATGTADSTTYLRGDNTWATVSSGGVTGAVGYTANCYSFGNCGNCPSPVALNVGILTALSGTLLYAQSATQNCQNCNCNC